MKNFVKFFNHNFENGNFKLFDKNHNLLYFEKSSGYWNKRTYDKKGNRIFNINSDSFWKEKHNISK